MWKPAKPWSLAEIRELYQDPGSFRSQVKEMLLKRQQTSPVSDPVNPDMFTPVSLSDDEYEDHSDEDVRMEDKYSDEEGDHSEDQSDEYDNGAEEKSTHHEGRAPNSDRNLAVGRRASRSRSQSPHRSPTVKPRSSTAKPLSPTANKPHSRVVKPSRSRSPSPSHRNKTLGAKRGNLHPVGKATGASVKGKQPRTAYDHITTSGQADDHVTSGGQSSDDGSESEELEYTERSIQQ